VSATLVLASSCDRLQKLLLHFFIRNRIQCKGRSNLILIGIEDMFKLIDRLVNRVKILLCKLSSYISNKDGITATVSCL
jgi:hypothetical protein